MKINYKRKERERKIFITSCIGVVFVVAFIFALSTGMLLENKNELDIKTTEKTRYPEPKGEEELANDKFSKLGEEINVKGNLGEEFLVTISNCRYSRKLLDEFSYKELLNSRYDNCFESDGTIKEKYCYLYIDVHVKNNGENAMLFTHSFNWYYVDGNKIGYDNDGQISAHNVYSYDKNNRIKHEFVEDFVKDEEIDFTLVYVIPEEKIDSIAILLNDHGKAGKNNLLVEDNIFVRIDKYIVE